VPATLLPHPLPAHAVALSGALPFRSGGDAAGLPQRVKILSWGENVGRTTGKLIVVDEESAAALSRNQELVACERVPMDYVHQSHPGHPNYRPDPRHSPGSGLIEVVPGDGIYLSAIEYTPNGVEHAASYQDVSAVVHLDSKKRPLWISSVALTQTGDVAGMEFKEAVAVLEAIQNPLPTEDNDMDTPYKAILLKLLGLPEGATDEEIQAAAEPKAAADDSAAMSARILNLEQHRETQERERLLDAAKAAGKVVPLSAEIIAQTPVAVLSAMIEGLPAGEVPLQGAQTEEKPGKEAVALSADEANAAKALGLTPEEFRAANPVG
jgi:phage I-like protein